MKTIWSIIFSIFIIYRIVWVIRDPSRRKIAGLIILILFAIGLYFYIPAVISESKWKREQEQSWRQQQNIEMVYWNKALEQSDIYIYLDRYPCIIYQIEQKKLIDRLYKTEDELWNFVLELETKDKKYCDMDVYYNYYLEKYPTGKHIRKAQKIIIDMRKKAEKDDIDRRVDDIAKSVTGATPPSVEEMYGDSTKTIKVRIENNSVTSFTILYSGKFESREIKIDKDSSVTNITLKRGEYRMAIPESSKYSLVKYENRFRIMNYSNSNDYFYKFSTWTNDIYN